MSEGRLQAGFTLLEMLVALCVLALLSVSISRGLDLGSFSFARARQDVFEAKRQRDALLLLRDLIGGAYPAFASADVTDRQVAFVGGADTMQLVTRRPARFGFPAMIVARIFVSDDQRLMLGWRLDLPRSDGAGALPEHLAVIAAPVGAVRFAYADANGWRNAWSGQAALPQRVSVAIDLWPNLTVAIRGTANTSCVYESTDIACARAP